MSRQEHQVVVVFDVTADDRDSAARAAVGLLNGTRGRHVLQDVPLAETVVESWWFPEADLKQIDGNHNAAMHLEPDDDGEAGDYCSACGASADDPHRAGCRWGEGCPAADPECDQDDGRTHDGCEAPPVTAVTAPVLLEHSDLYARAACGLPDCEQPLYMVRTESSAIYLSNTAKELATAGGDTSAWEVVCGAGHTILLPADTGADNYTFGLCDAHEDEDEQHDATCDDLARLRLVIASEPVA